LACEQSGQVILKQIADALDRQVRRRAGGENVSVMGILALPGKAAIPG